jgi:hypothetical protein
LFDGKHTIFAEKDVGEELSIKVELKKQGEEEEKEDKKRYQTVVFKRTKKMDYFPHEMPDETVCADKQTNKQSYFS